MYLDMCLRIIYLVETCEIMCSEDIYANVIILGNSLARALFSFLW